MSPPSKPSAPVNRLRIEPLADRQFGFFIGQSEVTRWYFSDLAPRPYFFPVKGPSGQSLTRMGHPRSSGSRSPPVLLVRTFRFCSESIFGLETTAARIRQSKWYAIEDGNDAARIAFELLWTDGHDPKPLLKQDVFATLRPAPQGWTLELQNDFRATGEGVEFRKSNFGVLGLRVAKSLSVVFGGGAITGADGF